VLTLLIYFARPAEKPAGPTFCVRAPERGRAKPARVRVEGFGLEYALPRSPGRKPEPASRPASRASVAADVAEDW